MEKLVYIAVIGSGEYEDYSETMVFCSFDKNIVQTWINRFNKIIEENEQRIKSNYEKDIDCFWSSCVVYEYPVAFIDTVVMKDTNKNSDIEYIDDLLSELEDIIHGEISDRITIARDKFSRLV